MKPQFIIFAALAATTFWVLAAESSTGIEHWVAAGESPKDYSIGLDIKHTVSGKGAKFIRSRSGNANTWGTLMQQISAERYRGQRVRFMAKVKTEKVNDWAGLWMRVDEPNHFNVAFYNSQNKPIKGTTDWQVRSVVLDVSKDASVLSFGVIDSGAGEVWLDDMSLEIVGPEVPVDIQVNHSALPDQPTL